MATKDTTASTSTPADGRTSPSTDERTTDATTSTGLDSNVAGALSYAFGIVTGVLFYLLEPDDEFVRYHAAQSMVVSGAFVALAVVFSVLGAVLSVLGSASATVGVAFGLASLAAGLLWFAVAFGGFALWLFLVVRAYQGKLTRVPVLAGIADRIA